MTNRCTRFVAETFPALENSIGSEPRFVDGTGVSLGRVIYSREERHGLSHVYFTNNHTFWGKHFRLPACIFAMTFVSGPRCINPAEAINSFHVAIGLYDQLRVETSVQLIRSKIFRPVIKSQKFFPDNSDRKNFAFFSRKKLIFF